MRIEVGAELLPGAVGEIGVTADDVDVRIIFIADPYRERRAPVAVARDRPVDVALEPGAEPALSHFRRMPVDARVPRKHRVLVAARLHEPRRARVVDERRSAAPAMRIRMHVLAGAEQQAATLQLFG